MPTAGQKEYLEQKVNPVLNELVAQILAKRPENAVSFAIQWLSECATERVQEITTMKAELNLLREEVHKLELEEEDALALKDEESEESDDDEMEDMPPPPPMDYFKRERSSVSAEAYGEFNKKYSFIPPVHPKTLEQKARIKSVLLNSFLFSHHDAHDIETLTEAMMEFECEAGTRLINQGDDGDCLYIVEAGHMGCYKKQGDGEEQLLKDCKAGDAFGELALLYNCPRAASCIAHEKCVLWRLDRESFNHIVKVATAARRERYCEFLRQVPILKTMDVYERERMCDVLQRQSHQAGTEIVRQGDVGDMFYILEEGECIASKVYVSGAPPKEVKHYQAGDYFGELALLMNEPRAATVTALTDCKLLALSRRTFKASLGPLEIILRRNASEYD